jgi:SNF2 family DNA or RNA helicase
MENRVEEFRTLVRYLRPELAATVDRSAAVAGPTAFRAAVAPVYLRRNQEDVLQELPELVQVDEWEQFGRDDGRAYREAVLSSDFMGMRQAAFHGGDPRSSAKLARLMDLVDEASANGLKVVVFSYFRRSLTVSADASREAGHAVFGPIDGGVPPAQRQRILDEFSGHEGPAVLVSQIQSGGVGLNMQAASVAVLCEPQVKPTLEAQAIARLHRMGQVRTVQVHRLLVENSVDQRLLDILDLKRRLFDEYARRSDTADSSPGARDISEADLARQVVEEEQERFAREAMAAKRAARSAATSSDARTGEDG